MFVVISGLGGKDVDALDSNNIAWTWWEKIWPNDRDVSKKVSPTEETTSALKRVN